MGEAGMLASILYTCMREQPSSVTIWVGVESRLFQIKIACPIYPPRPASINTGGLSLGNTLALPLFNEVSFHLRDHAERRKDHVPHVPSCRYVRVENGDKRTALFTLMYNVEHVTGVASQSVQARHHQFIVWPQEFNDGRQLVTPIAACPGRFL
jgi:hypothetical protein